MRRTRLLSFPVLAFLIFSTMLLERLSMGIPASSFAAKIEKTQYRGWNVYRLTNGLVSLLVAPDIGGRAIQLQLGDQEFFFVNPDLAGKVLPESENNLKSGWANYGGDKAWPGPEGWMNDGEWPSIPYYVLDGSRFAAEVVKETPGEMALRVTSPPDPRSGVQISRTFHVYAGTTRIAVDQVMRNVSRRQVRWGIWHLIQNDAADAHDPSKPNPELYMFLPLNPHSMYPQGYYHPYGDARHPSVKATDDGKMLEIHYLYRVVKTAADSNAGWYAVVNGQKNICMVENFKYFPGLEYPDGASVEHWNDGPGVISRGPWDQTLANDPKKTPYFMETEVMSPYAQLDPGEEYEFTVHWSPTRLPYPLKDAVWAGAISEPLTADVDRANQSVRLKGVFGVFTPGTLAATFYSVMGEELVHETLGPVDPREVTRLDKAVKLPLDTFRVSVAVLDQDGQNRGFLGNVIVMRVAPNGARSGQ